MDTRGKGCPVGSTIVNFGIFAAFDIRTPAGESGAVGNRRLP